LRQRCPIFFNDHRSIVLPSLFPVLLDVFRLFLVNARHGIAGAALRVEQFIELGVNRTRRVAFDLKWRNTDEHLKNGSPRRLRCLLSRLEFDLLPPPCGGAAKPRGSLPRAAPYRASSGWASRLAVRLLAEAVEPPIWLWPTPE
jgi:hypothetical protein